MVLISAVVCMMLIVREASNSFININLITIFDIQEFSTRRPNDRRLFRSRETFNEHEEFVGC
jgi:hypothetical protein